MKQHHYKIGDEPVVMHSDPKLQERFWAKVQKTDGCWLWVAGKDQGYGSFGINRSGRRAHRVSYEMANGPVPEGLELDHLCRNRACVRPDHLEPVTHLENVRRGQSGQHYRVRTHCPRGHEYTPENTRIQIRKTGPSGRACRICDRELGRERQRRYRADARAQVRSSG